MSSTAQRNLPVEDTAAAVLRFEKGGMAQMTVSDAAVGPWAWDISAGENLARFPAHPIQSHLFAGTEAGMSLPDLAVWSHEGEKSWTKTLRRRLLPAEPEDCYQAQLRHFGEVIAGRARPLVSAIEGTKDLATVLAIGMAAGTSRETEVESVSTHGAERKRAS